MDLFRRNLLSPPHLPLSLPLLSYHHPPINSFPVQSHAASVFSCFSIFILRGESRNVQVGANMRWKQTPAWRTLPIMILLVQEIKFTVEHPAEIRNTFLLKYIRQEKPKKNDPAVNNHCDP